jgi:hypothetical protein
MDTQKHYPTHELPSGANRDESRRIALCVVAATRRQAHENTAGQCAINLPANHKPSHFQMWRGISIQ